LQDIVPVDVRVGVGGLSGIVAPGVDNKTVVRVDITGLVGGVVTGADAPSRVAAIGTGI
jgi:hypothetical protein